jgi:hypothetical protein
MVCSQEKAAMGSFYQAMSSEGCLLKLRGPRAAVISLIAIENFVIAEEFS